MMFFFFFGRICCLLEQTLFAETQPTKLSTEIIPASCAQIEETALFTALTKKQPHVMLIHYYSVLLFQTIVFFSLTPFNYIY